MGIEVFLSSRRSFLVWVLRTTRKTSGVFGMGVEVEFVLSQVFLVVGSRTSDTNLCILGSGFEENGLVERSFGRCILGRGFEALD